MPRMGVTLLLLGIAQLFLAIIYRDISPGIVILLLWSGGAFTAVGIAYALRRPSIFGKDPRKGYLSPLSLALLLPFLLLTYLIWECKALFLRETIYHEIAPGIFLGRRPRNLSELPPGTQMVVDLTSEFPLARQIAAAIPEYRCLPTLDHAAPVDPDAFTTLMDEVVAFTNGPVYVHCAVGRGRSALFVAALLHARGIAPDRVSAWEQVRQKRSHVALSAEQKRFLFR